MNNRESMYRCPSCPTMVYLEWHDGNGAVPTEPVVKCANPNCSNLDGRLELAASKKENNRES